MDQHLGTPKKLLVQVLVILVTLNCVELRFGFGHFPDSEIDENCSTEDNEEGKCMHIRECQTAKKYFEENKYPTPCFHFGRPIICCPNASPELSGRINVENEQGSISNQKCLKYSHMKFVMRSEAVTLYGGIQATPKEFPHMAAIGFGSESNIQWNCGGSLISENFVMTAAHCTSSKEFGTAKWVRLGDLNLRKTEDDGNALTATVKRAIRHPNYKLPSQYNDIGLLELDRPITISRFIRPACLQTEASLPEGCIPVATGWGQTQYAGASSDHLMKVELKFYGIEQCRKSYTSVAPRKLSKGIMDENQICAGGKEGEEGKDTCPGDSGGPLQIKHKKFSQSYVIVGITSFGKACAIGNSPGVYTRVSNFIPWIESIVWPQK